eukprot:TRINITY_DN377_c0_g1_i1.p1 TRINITY_DN377_c0_g1~~TRINITY_DN377_c0_g1_i1.p1  ORF type:complete len:460 (-),score=26.38 TRINITY_DN377_c0_g1_i1:145-1524(-)
MDACHTPVAATCQPRDMKLVYPMGDSAQSTLHSDIMKDAEKFPFLYFGLLEPRDPRFSKAIAYVTKSETILTEEAASSLRHECHSYKLLADQTLKENDDLIKQLEGKVSTPQLEVFHTQSTALQTALSLTKLLERSDHQVARLEQEVVLKGALQQKSEAHTVILQAELVKATKDTETLSQRVDQRIRDFELLLEQERRRSEEERQKCAKQLEDQRQSFAQQLTQERDSFESRLNNQRRRSDEERQKCAKQLEDQRQSFAQQLTQERESFEHRFTQLQQRSDQRLDQLLEQAKEERKQAKEERASLATERTTLQGKFEAISREVDTLKVKLSRLQTSHDLVKLGDLALTVEAILRREYRSTAKGSEILREHVNTPFSGLPGVAICFTAAHSQALRTLCAQRTSLVHHLGENRMEGLHEVETLVDSDSMPVSKQVLWDFIAIVKNYPQAKFEEAMQSYHSS